MANSPVIIETKDCFPFPDGNTEVLRYFSEQNTEFSVFNILLREKKEEPLVSFNYTDKQWYAGRYIGSITFNCNKEDYEIQIKPRFGDAVLFQMFEELFNIKFSPGSSAFKMDNTAYYLKLLISFIWLQKLAKANRHGLPRVKQVAENTGYTLKGKLLIRPTLQTLYTNGKIVTARKEQVFDHVVLRILFQAYNVLKKEYQLGLLKIPPNALEVIQTVENQTGEDSYVHQYEYQSIKYHPIYQNYKDIVDFSWQIIQSQPGYSSQNTKKNISGFFLDMAEIWECYVRSIVKKRFGTAGWQFVDSQYPVYSKRFYGRKIIPDIVMKRDNEYCVFDAKYKSMQFRPGTLDVDREDFFQIHTYIAYLLTKGRVILGGLIYPSTTTPINTEIFPSNLFGTDEGSTSFVVDGPVIDSQSIDTTRLFTNISNCFERQYAEVP